MSRTQFDNVGELVDYLSTLDRGLPIILAYPKYSHRYAQIEKEWEYLDTGEVTDRPGYHGDQTEALILTSAIFFGRYNHEGW